MQQRSKLKLDKRDLEENPLLSSSFHLQFIAEKIKLGLNLITQFM